ncbi:MAG: T9SS type A sorting domain-containing protein [Ignavibacteria bacterium]|nr:T9SS type A sorting domain-containing protein [Ignavibacteria bacterium]
MKNKFTVLIILIITAFNFNTGYSQTSDTSSFTWTAIGNGVSSSVNDIFIKSENEIYAAGQFVNAGGITVNRIAVWNGTEWSALGTGVNGTVHTIAIDGDDVYAGGDFTTAGGVTVNRIAKWNGTSWSALGTGVNHRVKKIIIHNGNIYVSGFFTIAGSDSASQIAKWDGVSWSALGSGINLNLDAMAVSQSGIVYAGGLFNLAGGVTVRNIAQWNGSSWSAVGSGVRGEIKGMHCLGNDLYITGFIDSAGDISANNIARWDGSSWSAIGNGVTGAPVCVYPVSNNEIYLGGFTGSPSGSLFAKWNGSKWSFPTPALNSFILSISKFNDLLIVGGQFNFFGSSPLNHIARLTDVITGTGNSNEIIQGFKLYQNFPNPFNPETTIKYSIPASSEYTLKIFEINGKEIETLVNKFSAPGEYSVQWNASEYSSGVYFYKLSSDKFSSVKRMLLLK